MTHGRIHPDWLACGRCLWYSDSMDCFHSPRLIPTDSKAFCASWTCARCWSPWAIYLSALDSQPGFLDHNLCEPATFGKEETP